MPKIKQDDPPKGIADRAAAGKNLRKQAPRASHAGWKPAANRPDPIALLQQHDAERLQHLLPIKYGRMLASPFAFLRGSAVVMAADLAATPVTGLEVALCGDAHLSNFGLFATPERNLVFDINDFDETYPGPWEWDLKRLAVSAVVAGRGNGFDDKTCRKMAGVVARVYREAMQRAAGMTILDVWYHHIDASAVIDLFARYAAASAKQAAKTVNKARTKTSAYTLEKLTHVVDGKRQIVNAPPLVVRLSELLTAEEKAAASAHGSVEQAWQGYLDSLPEERRRLLKRFQITDAALRVVGVGSVGTRCAIALLEGDKPEDALILQQKQVGPSALEAYLPKQTFSNQAERVIIGQHLIQASSDSFLGWSAEPSGRHYYWRQLADMKGSFDAATFDAEGLAAYLEVCALCLARAHARSGDAVAISSYLGAETVFDDAISQFAVAYADQTAHDHQVLMDAVKRGQIRAETGI